MKYKPNPDGSVNTNGRKLRKILKNNKNNTLLNGLIHANRSFDSKFTFFRGYNASQNDVCLTNNTVDTCELKILDKLPLSDHCPVVINFKGNSNCSTDLLNKCAIGFRSYDHADVNLRLRKTTKLEHCNLANLVYDLEVLGTILLADYTDNPVITADDIERLNSRISVGIYDSIHKNKRRQNNHEVSDLFVKHNNCDSKHFKAIADANKMC